MKSLTTDEIGLNDALAARRGGGDRDRLRRADPAAGRRLVVAHPGAGHPPQPHRDPRPAPAHDRARRPDATIRPRWPRPPARHLRERFLRARVGISGANFAIADTGSLVVLESEGNGRMCTTLPELLISVVGIEKLLPSFERPGRVHAAAAPLLHRRADEPVHVDLDRRHARATGRSELHIVLLDNGRTDVLSDPEGREALHCIRCSACLNVCPVYERTGGHAYGSIYPGPIGAILTPQLEGIERGRHPALRLQPVRRLLRGLPGQDRHPARCWCTCAA